MQHLMVLMPRYSVHHEHDEFIHCHIAEKMCLELYHISTYET